MTNLSLQKKTAARVAAVQCLYQFAIGKEKRTPEQLAEALKKRLHNNKGEQKLVLGVVLEPNYTLLVALLTGIIDRLDDIDKRLDSVLKTKWKRDRMSPVLIAIFQCAIFELFFYKETAHKIVIGEYTKLAGRFLDDADVPFVHGALMGLAKKYHE